MRWKPPNWHEPAVAADPRKSSFDNPALGKTSKPAASERFTMRNRHAPVRQTTSAVFFPVYRHQQICVR